MFTPLGLFKEVPCPQGGDCTLITCIFSHAEIKPVLPAAKPQQRTETDVRVHEEPVVKRRKIASEQDYRKVHGDSHSSPDISDLQSISRKVSPPPARAQQKKEVPTAAGTSPKTTDQTRKDASRQSNHLRRQAPKESLNPRMVTKSPATYAVRSSILSKLHAAMTSQNDKMTKLNKTQDSSLVLSPDELIIMALDEEEKVAKENPKIYANVIKLRIVKLQKMPQEDWGKEVLTHLNKRYYKVEKQQTTHKVDKFTTDLTPDEEIAIAAKLRTELKGKEQFGYVTKVPSKEEVESAKQGIEAAQGWEKCDRCAGRFQVFPGRREDGALATGGHCTYHPGKLVRPSRKATDHITGQSEAYFPCCHETVGTSAGCTKAEHHVFKISEAKRLAAVLQFEETPPQPDKGPMAPICFDCEMAYTTLGLELIRLTALTWPDGEAVLDVLVKPMGEVLDLNSRYSGVFPEHYKNAIPHGAPAPDIKAADLEDGELSTPPMRVVESPAAARALLFQFLQPDTPLIGHAIDNDLNACRIVHPTIIDTVLLFPHPRGLPIRYGLKHLSKLHLDRDIQTGGDKGHDSNEDAKATGDLVRFKAAERWKVLKRQGWTIRGGRLVSSAEQSLGSWAGQKRKTDDEPTSAET